MQHCHFQILITLNTTAVFNPSIGGGEEKYILLRSPLAKFIVLVFISQIPTTFKVLYSQENINRDFLVTGRV